MVMNNLVGRIWGRSLKYALWALSRERCVVMGQGHDNRDKSVYTADTHRLVFNDAMRLINEGLMTPDCQLTAKGLSMVPTTLSPTAHAQAMRMVQPGVRFMLSGQNAMRADGWKVGEGDAAVVTGSSDKISRYVAEMLLAKGVLVYDKDGYIVRAEASPRLAWTTVLWTLSNEPCYLVGDVIKAVSDDRVVHEDAHSLEVSGYITTVGGVAITPVGRRLIPKRLGDTTIVKTMAAFEASARWQFQGHWVVGENEGRLPRYTIERLIQMGKLQIDTGGYVVKPEETKCYKCHLTASQYAMISRVIKLELVR